MSACFSHVDSRARDSTRRLSQAWCPYSQHSHPTHWPWQIGGFQAGAFCAGIALVCPCRTHYCQARKTVEAQASRLHAAWHPWRWANQKPQRPLINVPSSCCHCISLGILTGARHECMPTSVDTSIRVQALWLVRCHHSHHPTPNDCLSTLTHSIHLCQ